MAFDNPFAQEIWTAKYRFAPTEGRGDATMEETWARVAEATAQAEAPARREAYRAEAYDALAGFKLRS